jgi:hypothetical protein
MEHGYRLEIVAAIAAEAAAIVSLAVFLALAETRAQPPGATLLARGYFGDAASALTATEAYHAATVHAHYARTAGQLGLGRSARPTA